MPYTSSLLLKLTPGVLLRRAVGAWPTVAAPSVWAAPCLWRSADTTRTAGPPPTWTPTWSLASWWRPPCCRLLVGAHNTPICYSPFAGCCCHYPLIQHGFWWGYVSNTLGKSHGTLTAQGRGSGMLKVRREMKISSCNEGLWPLGAVFHGELSWLLRKRIKAGVFNGCFFSK